MENIDSQDAAPVIPGFAPLRQLGKGAGATVWLARRDADRGLFAVKCLVPGSDAKLNAPQDLRREVRITSVLSHRHLVRIHDVVPLSGSDEGGMGLVMDYAPGGSLGQLVAGRGKLSVGEAVTVMTPIAQVLAYLHHNGFVHGDLSPGNVLFTELGKPLLADLGLAKMVGDGGSAASTGTPGFTAPPTEDGSGTDIRPDRDVFALAALGWYCLTGSAPDAGPRRPPLSVLVPDVPPHLAAALEAGLSPDAGQRPTAAEFAALVFRSAAAEPVDLSASVHASVLPRLLTRRQASESRRGKRISFGAFSFGARTVIPRGHRGRRPALPAPFHQLRQGSGGSGTGDSGRLLSTLWLLLALAAAVWVFAAGTTALVAWWPFPESSASADGSAPPRHEDSRLSQGIEERTRSEDPVEAIHALAELRSMAIRSVSEEALGKVNVPGSPAAGADLETLAGLRSAGVVLDGFTTTLHDVSVLPGAGEGHAVVRVRAEASTYREQDSSGAVVATRAAAPARHLQLVLQRTPDGWRISDVRADVQAEGG